jgi:hypothetical protein
MREFAGKDLHSSGYRRKMRQYCEARRRQQGGFGVVIYGRSSTRTRANGQSIEQLVAAAAGSVGGCRRTRLISAAGE